MGKSAALLFALVFLTASCLITPLPVKADSITIVVPDDFQTIQAAIDNAAAGDTVFIKNGTYYAESSSIVIDKSISFIGEDADYTIIDGQPLPYGGTAIKVTAPNVTISGFTITNLDGLAIDLQNYDSYVSACKIIGNNIVNSEDGIWVETGTNFIIENNNISNNSHWGIYLYPHAANGTISENKITENGLREGRGGGICLFSGTNITIVDNIFSDGYDGLSLSFCGPCYVYGNIITDNQGYGITFGESCNNATVSRNSISRNGVGITLGTFPLGGITITPSNVVYRNDLVDNSQQAIVDDTVDWGTFVTGTDIVAWDNGQAGNYWSNYNGTDANKDGIGDTPYVIDGDNVDNYPLMASFKVDPNAVVLPTPEDINTPTVPPTSPTPIQEATPSPDHRIEPYPIPALYVAAASVAVVVVVGAGLVYYFKKRKH